MNKGLYMIINSRDASMVGILLRSCRMVLILHPWIPAQKTGGMTES
jgi:hypothetical protein